MAGAVDSDPFYQWILGLLLKYLPHNVRRKFSELDYDSALQSTGLMTIASKLGLSHPESKTLQMRQHPTMDLIDHFARQNICLREWQAALESMNSNLSEVLKDPSVQQEIQIEYRRQHPSLGRSVFLPTSHGIPEPTENSWPCRCQGPPSYHSNVNPTPMQPSGPQNINMIHQRPRCNYTPNMQPTLSAHGAYSVESNTAYCADREQTFYKTPIEANARCPTFQTQLSMHSTKTFEQSAEETHLKNRSIPGASSGSLCKKVNMSGPCMSNCPQSCNKQCRDSMIFRKRNEVSRRKTNAQGDLSLRIGSSISDPEISRHSSPTETQSSLRWSLTNDQSLFAEALPKKMTSSSGQQKRIMFTYGAHSNEHLKEVGEMVHAIENDGNSVNVDMDKIAMSKKYPNEPDWLDKTYDHADYIVICISPTYLRDLVSEANPGALNGRYLYERLRKEYTDNKCRNTKMIPILFTNSGAISARQLPPCMSSTLSYNYPKGLPQLCQFIKDHKK